MKSYFNGFSFPIPVLINGLIFFLFSFAVIPENMILGLILLVLGSLIIFNTVGIEISGETKMIKQYTRVFGIKFGKWQSVDNYTCISLLNVRMRSRTYGGSSNRSVQTSSNKTIIYLLNDSHLKKLAIVEAGISEAEEISKLLDLPIVKYSPQISSKSRARRRR